MQCHFISRHPGEAKETKGRDSTRENNSHGNVSLMKAIKKTTFVGKIVVGQVSRGEKPDLVVDFCFYNLWWVLVVMFC